MSGHLGKQLLDLMNSAIDSRTSVGIVGLALALWVGLGWMANLREALSQMWQERHQPAGFVRTKLSDLLAMASSFAAIAVTVALTAIGNATVMGKYCTSWAFTTFRCWTRCCAAFRYWCRCWCPGCSSPG